MRDDEFSPSINGDAVRLFGKVRRPYFSINECFQSGFPSAVIDIADPPRWIERSSRLWYRKSIKGGNQFVMVNADTQAKAPAFDHEKLDVYQLAIEFVANENKQLLERLSQMLTKLVKAQKDHE